MQTLLLARKGLDKKKKKRKKGQNKKRREKGKNGEESKSRTNRSLKSHEDGSS